MNHYSHIASTGFSRQELPNRRSRQDVYGYWFDSDRNDEKTITVTIVGEEEKRERVSYWSMHDHMRNSRIQALQQACH
ncbi:hypothetical protein ACFSJZ_00560 [Veronia pacifica]